MRKATPPEPAGTPGTAPASGPLLTGTPGPNVPTPILWPGSVAVLTGPQALATGLRLAEASLARWEQQQWPRVGAVLATWRWPARGYPVASGRFVVAQGGGPARAEALLAALLVRPEVGLVLVPEADELCLAWARGRRRHLPWWLEACRQHATAWICTFASADVCARGAAAEVLAWASARAQTCQPLQDALPSWVSPYTRKKTTRSRLI